MKILVTGGAGFIGSAVIRYLIDCTDHSVVNVDSLTYAGNLESVAPVSKSDRYEFHRVDICDKSALNEVFDRSQPDAVMHLAAESHVDRSIDGPAIFIETNIVGTYCLLDVSRKYWMAMEGQRKESFRFHHVSTDEVYGDLIDPAALFTENTAYAPSSPYSASKASADHLVRAWSRTYGLPTLITNCSNNYGPYHFPEKLIPLVILNAIQGKTLPVYGKGDQIRDWLFVEDHARALVRVITLGVVGETYNIGGHNEKTNLAVIHEICSLLDKRCPLEKPSNFKAAAAMHNRGLAGRSYKELITHVADRPGHDQRYAIDASKIERDLGWVPEESFETGIRKTIDWYLSNPGWVDRIKSGEYQSWLEKNYQTRAPA